MMRTHQMQSRRPSAQSSQVPSAATGSDQRDLYNNQGERLGLAECFGSAEWTHDGAVQFLDIVLSSKPCEAPCPVIALDYVVLDRTRSIEPLRGPQFYHCS